MAPMSFPNPSLIGYETSTNTDVTVQAFSTLILPANPERLYAEVRNISTQPIWIAKGVPAVVGKGTRMQAGSVRTFTDNELYLGALYAIAGSPQVIEVEEGT